NAAGINFNAVASGNYSIAPAATHTLTFVGPGAVNVAAGLSPTIAAPIAGTSGIILAGPGTLNLTGANTFTGPVAVNSGTLSVGAGGNLGASSNALTIGTSNGGTTVNDATGA